MAMTYAWDGESRKRVLGKVAQHLHDEGTKDLDGFSSGLVSRVGAHVQKQGKFPHELELEAMIGGIKTSFFRANRHLKKKELASWIAALLAAEAVALFRPISTAMLAQAGAGLQAIRTSVDDIDSFQEIRTVSSHEVENLVPLEISESHIKQSIAQIVGEPFVEKDWGGEIADLFTAHLIFQGNPVPTGFLLKGPGVRGRLTIRHLGKNGDQVVRLTSTSLALYVV